METKVSLEQQTIDDLNCLIRTNLDSQEALNQLQEQLQDPCAAYFNEVAGQRAEQAAELQTLVCDNSEEPADSGTTWGGVTRAWANLRVALGGDKGTILSEAEAEEDRIKEAYEDVLKKNPGTAVSDVLHRHMAAVKIAHDRIRDLRDRENA